MTRTEMPKIPNHYMKIYSHTSKSLNRGSSFNSQAPHIDSFKEYDSDCNRSYDEESLKRIRMKNSKRLKKIKEFDESTGNFY